MRLTEWTAMVLFAALPLSAQDEGREQQKQEQSSTAALEALLGEFNEARAGYIRAAQEKGERVDTSIPARAFVERFAAAAKERAGTEAAVPFLAWIVTNGAGDPEAVGTAVDEILAHHVQSAQLALMAGSVSRLGAVVGEDRAATLKRRLLEDGHPEVQATMLFFSGYSGLRRRGVSEEDRAAALADLRRAAELEGEYAEMAGGILFEQERLQIGMAAPDIVGPDLDGEEFKLSDYRGKVVVIDFWGDW